MPEGAGPRLPSARESEESTIVVDGNGTHWTTVALGEIDSTNNEARRRVASGAIEKPTLIRADRQTAGRGRGANAWWSDAGSLTFSLVFAPDHFGLRSHQLPRVAIATAVGLIEAMEQGRLLPPGVLGIRWPNDIESIDGKKLGGILPEAIRNPRGADFLIVGIGLNVSTDLDAAPPAVQALATSIQRLGGVPVDVETFLATALRCLDSAMTDLATEDARLFDCWRSRDLLLGRRARVVVGERTLEGRGRGIDPEGRLRLELDDGSLESVVAGQVLRENP
jgi:BirA family biotin operon repressor/biotin-[acetyl-CoA-carboxylase] ligase